MKFHFHTYGKWSDPIPTSNSGHKQQWRVCTKCNKAQFRTLCWDEQVNLTSVLSAIATVKEKK